MCGTSSLKEGGGVTPSQRISLCAKKFKENRESSTTSISRKILLHLFLNFMKLILREKNHIEY